MLSSSDRHDRGMTRSAYANARRTRDVVMLWKNRGTFGNFFSFGCTVLNVKVSAHIYRMAPKRGQCASVNWPPTSSKRPTNLRYFDTLQRCFILSSLVNSILIKFITQSGILWRKQPRFRFWRLLLKFQHKIRIIIRLERLLSEWNRQRRISKFERRKTEDVHGLLHQQQTLCFLES